MEEEIPFGAFDSELMHQEISIPEGFEATIEGNKIILKKIESEDERIRKALVRFHKSTIDVDGIKGEDIIAWLEKQGETFTKRDVDDAFVEGMAFAKNELEKQDEQNEKIKKDIAEFIFNSKEYIKYRYDWIKCLGYDIHFIDKEKQAEPKRMISAEAKEAMYDKPAEWSEEDKKLTDVNHDYFSELLENNNSKDINDYAHQVAYCMSHDWIKDTATWDDVEKACKLGAKWNEKHHKSTWSEEDEEMFEYTISLLNYNLGCRKWLQSLKERHIWKPSEEQIKALHDLNLTGNISYAGQGQVLIELYNDLKKLKGE